jgi:hypothetical protein
MLPLLLLLLLAEVLLLLWSKWEERGWKKSLRWSGQRWRIPWCHIFLVRSVQFISRVASICRQCHKKIFVRQKSSTALLTWQRLVRDKHSSLLIDRHNDNTFKDFTYNINKSSITYMFYIYFRKQSHLII